MHDYYRKRKTLELFSISWLDRAIAETVVGKRQMGWGKFSNLNKICLPLPVSKILSDYVSDPLISSVERERSKGKYLEKQSLYFALPVLCLNRFSH